MLVYQRVYLQKYSIKIQTYLRKKKHQIYSYSIPMKCWYSWPIMALKWRPRTMISNKGHAGRCSANPKNRLMLCKDDLCDMVRRIWSKASNMLNARISMISHDSRHEILVFHCVSVKFFGLKHQKTSETSEKHLRCSNLCPTVLLGVKTTKESVKLVRYR